MAKGHFMSAPQTWLPVADAARVAGISEKALRRRMERGTVQAETDQQGRRVVLTASLASRRSAPPRPDGNAPVSAPVPGLVEVLARLEVLAAENGKLRALTQIAESTEDRLTAELVELRAELMTTREQLAAVQVTRHRWWRRSES